MARPKLNIASSESSADQLYATKFRAPDPFVFLQTAHKKLLLLSDLEIDRARHDAKVDAVHAFSSIEKRIQGLKKKKPSYARVVSVWLQENNCPDVQVPATFPIDLARSLKKEGIRIKPAKGPFWPKREFKTAAEVRHVEAALRIAETGMSRAFEILAATKIRKDGRLFLGRRLLTAELLRMEIEISIIRVGGEARGDTIVSSGEQGCDPHERGRGPLYANELIILDIFPRHVRSGYFGDITRTVIRGQASDAQRHLWETCLAGQNLALKEMKIGVQGGVIQETVKSFFTENGYPTEIRKGHWQGFFHGLGHGLGLEVHESPRFSATTLQAGQVITVEPGIYMPGLGGVRHEDVALVTPVGPRLLTHFPKPLEI